MFFSGYFFYKLRILKGTVAVYNKNSARQQPKTFDQHTVCFAKGCAAVSTQSCHIFNTFRTTPAFLSERQVHADDKYVHAVQRTGLLPHIEVYRTKVPLYPGADFGFFA